MGVGGSGVGVGGATYLQHTWVYEEQVPETITSFTPQGAERQV